MQVGDAAVFTVTTVCTGNLCRSPFAEAVLGRELVDVDATRVRSRGTHPATAAPPPESMLRAAARHDVDLRGHRPRALDRESVESSGLLLALGREHRGAVALLSPRASRRTFTLLEFGQLASTLTPADAARAAMLPTAPERLAEVVRVLSTRRGHLARPSRSRRLSIDDPFGGAAAGYDECVDTIQRALAPVAACLRAAANVADDAAGGRCGALG